MSDVPARASASHSSLEGAVQLHSRGALDEAALAYEDLLRGTPDDARVLTKLGLVRLQQNRLDAAVAFLDRALAADPAAAEAQAWRGEALRRRRELEPAIAAFRAALDRDRDFAPAWFNLALAEAERGNRASARDAWMAFDRLRPADPRVCRELGRLAYDSGDHADAILWFSRQLERTPGHADAEAAFRIGLALDRMARLDEAVEWYGKAALLAPGRAAIRVAAGVAHFNLGNVDRALGEYRAALALDPDNREARGNLLMALNHVDPPDHELHFAEHLAWAARHANAAEMPRGAFPNQRDPRRRLKIGYVSPRFGGGPLAHLFLPLIEAHDRAAVHVTCYAVSALADETTALMRTHADEWCDAAAQDDDALVARIRADRIDILVDLVGHCPGNRLGVFARRGAPIQLTWLDYDGTTGVPAMDYIVTDAIHTPVDGSQRYTERVLRLPDTRICYRPTLPLPRLEDSPAAARGYVTFGCINRLNKLGPNVLATWAQVLALVPRSRLLLKATAFAAEATRATVRLRFAQHGVAADRLDLRPYTTEAHMMQEYAEIDVALDPFPYNGCTTTCDALSMGVPVVTLEGTTLTGRHGVAFLTACGLSSNVARSRDEYVALAARTAHAGGSTGAARAALRERFLASPICDGPRFARAFECLYRDVWIAWCDEGG
jgi:predicted O-linked N-acetylglucosamine transferase (SPINDLY family)